MSDVSADSGGSGVESGPDRGADSPWRRPADGARTPDAGAGDPERREAAVPDPGGSGAPRAGGTPRPGRGPSGFTAPVVTRGRLRPTFPGDNTAAWTRPAGSPRSPGPEPPAPESPGPESPGPGTGPPAGVFAYTGPPPSNPPPANWRPPMVSQPLPPLELPAQDHDRLDIEEQAARALTQGIGMVVGAILLVLLLVLCARAAF